MVSFESDYPQDFVDLVKELRETEASTYTQRDTPMFTGIQQELHTLLSRVGGAAVK